MPKPSTRETGFVGSIPESYDRYLRPLLFDSPAAVLAERVVLPHGRPAAVLEVGAGTGALTAQMRARLPGDVVITATDLSEAMLAVAQRRLKALGLSEGVTCRTADAMDLPFDDASFDVVACQFAVMVLSDKPRAAREARRVLRPGGQWLFSVFGSWEENPFGRLLHDTISGFYAQDPPQVYRMPFAFHDPEALRSLALGAGFDDPSIMTLDRVAEAPSAAEVGIGFVQGNQLLMEIRERGTATPEQVSEAIAQRFATVYGDHPVRFPTRFLVVSARKPAQ